MTLVAAVVLSYLMGSIPFGLVFTRPRGVDPRQVGSGNIGATNVMRAAGKGTAALTLLGDLLKGTAAVALGKVLGLGAVEQGVLGLMAVLGHDFSLFLRFRGGKGVATSLGVLLLYLPLAGLITVGLWFLTATVTRRSSLGALISFSLAPAVVFLLKNPLPVVGIVCIMCVLLIARHHENIRRLTRGTEGRIGDKA